MHRAGGDGSLLRRINGAAAMHALHRADSVTLRELASQMGVSRNTAEDAVATLIAGGLACEIRPEDGDNRPVGRPAKRYRFRADAGLVLGVDFAVHEVKVLATDLRGTVLFQRRQPIDPSSPPEVRLDQARAAMLAAGEAGSVLAVGVASTGVVSDRGCLVVSERLPAMVGCDLATELAVFDGCAVLIGNDARLATLAEQWRGAATGVDNFVNVLAGRRVTAGIVLGARLLRGVHGAAGEIGVLPEARWGEALSDMAAWPGTPEAVFAAAADSDPEAVARVDSVAAKLAIGLASIVLTVDPDCVVLSGGLARAGAAIIDPLQRHLDVLTLFPIPIRRSTLDNEAVALGAVRMALDHIEQDLFDADSARMTSLFADRSTAG